MYRSYIQYWWGLVSVLCNQYLHYKLQFSKKYAIWHRRHDTEEDIVIKHRIRSVFKPARLVVTWINSPSSSSKDKVSELSRWCLSSLARRALPVCLSAHRCTSWVLRVRFKTDIGLPARYCKSIAQLHELFILFFYHSCMISAELKSTLNHAWWKYSKNSVLKLLHIHTVEPVNKFIITSRPVSSFEIKFYGF